MMKKVYFVNNLFRMPFPFYYYYYYYYYYLILLNFDKLNIFYKKKK